ncbi:uncharacterized protein BT62DRAFT_1081312 [Guyanagaster necrorhizus]|uniref:Uncharacterized protein n=1 Tax=Guyanagaster necrorhizus TaxID=856835 RepID=A0A9P8ALM1_9AGAR|nr:uncharacterized protein BT62DRAFT_1081312 [Guyanagaster necrorhizus MCA 3950]KAG7439791.1 hypothetical protein BT62DRAFT_1081312 [Guyanagaster necrorhizus MCA 3950]
MGCHWWLNRHQLFRTQVSIKLNEATSSLSVLPVDWSVVVYDPPDAEEIDPISLQRSWGTIIAGIRSDMVQPVHSLGGIGRAIKGSTYHHCARHFHDRFCISEKKGDLRFINLYIGTATRRPLNFRNILSEIYGIIIFAFTVSCADAIERHSWDHVLAQKTV